MEPYDRGSAPVEPSRTAGTRNNARALVLSSFGWPSVVRLSLALGAAGFATALVLPRIGIARCAAR